MWTSNLNMVYDFNLSIEEIKIFLVNVGILF